MAKGKGGGSGGSGGGKPSSAPSGGGGNSGSKPSGGGSSPSGGGSSGSGSRPSGGGSSPSGGGSNTPAKAVTAATIYQAAQSSAPSKPSTQSSRPTVTPTRPSTQSSGGSSPSNQQNRVQQLTQKAKTLIGGATSEGLADPNKFKDVLGKLKDLGKDTKVQNLQTQKKEAVTAAKTAAKPPGTTFTGFTQEQMDDAIAKAVAGAQSSTGITQEDLDAALAKQSETGLTQDDLDAALSRYQSQNTASQSAASDTGAAASSTNEYQDWLNSFATEQDKGAFDPDLFNSLLGELESSKYRQKQWNERSARSAYGF